MELTKEELDIVSLWFLSCEDMEVPLGGCEKCNFLKDCKGALQKLKLTVKHGK